MDSGKCYEILLLLLLETKHISVYRTSLVQNHAELLLCCALQAHSSVERACLLGAVRCRKVPSDDKNCMRGQALMSAIQEDLRNGLVPFFVGYQSCSVYGYI
jgi:glutamate/tyrosine decarboxylase-like PLP-dependent enzyme